MADIFAEVDEAMRQERIMKFWKDNGTYIIALVAAVIVITGSVSFYRDWQAGVNQDSTTQAIALLDREDGASAVTLEEIQAIQSDSIRALTALNIAGQLVGDDGQREKAISLYTLVAQDKSTPETLKHIAQSALAKLEDDQDAALATLRTIADDTNSPLRAYAMLEHAALKAADQDYSAAITILDEIIAAPGFPSSIYTRANALKHVYSIQNTANNDNDTAE